MKAGSRTVAARCSLVVLMLLAATPFTGCGKTESGEKLHAPVAIQAGDECHLCGMIIGRFPGPKGETYVRGSDRPLKFCSTRDLFGFLLQPENRARATQVFVHDMGATDWAHPDDSAFVPARSAWYVADQPLQGSMGPTLASFRKKEDAHAFIARHGGRLLRFEDITLDLLAKLGEGGAKSAQP